MAENVKADSKTETTENKVDTKAAKGDKDKKGGKSSLKSWWGDIKGEYKKIVWPTRDDVIKDTVTVIVTCAIVGVVVCGFDILFGWAYQALVNFVG